MNVILATDSLVRPLTGIGNYTLALAQALQESHEVDELLFASSTTLTDHISIQDPPSGRSRLESIKRLFPDAIRRYRIQRRKSLSEQLPAGYVFHGTNYAIPKYAGATVATIHDLSILEHPNWHPEDRVRFLSDAISDSMERADVLMFDSAFVKDRAAKRFPEHSNKMYVVPLPSRLPRPPAETVNKQRNNFILGLVGDNPRKNSQALLRAYSHIPEDQRNDFTLKIVGLYTTPENDSRATPPEVQFLGFVSDQELRRLYQEAAFAIFPSVYEGFGLPIVESVSQGTEVLVHDYEGTREFDLPGVHRCDTTAEETFSLAIQKMMERSDSKLDREAMIAAVDRQYGIGQWVDGTLSCYRLALAKH